MYLFALFLVLYEFTTYSANDMIMPGMIDVVKYFHAPEYYVAFSMSLYILGNCAFLLFAGFTSERYGKRKTMLWGNLLFLLFTLAIIFSTNINEFMWWRFLQGSGMAIIVIGYALIHENFNDKAAIKLVALMANVSLLAPLIGPALGSFIMSFWTWQTIFYVSTALSIATLIGLFLFTPKENPPKTLPTINQTIKQYIAILKTKEFYQGAIVSVFIVMPLLLWISQAPNLILYKLQLDYTHYVIYQLISIGGLSTSSILMQFIVGKFRIYSIVKVGGFLILIGLLITLLGIHSIEIITMGIFVFALGMGLANGCIWRLIMTIKGFPHSMLASMEGFIQTISFAVGITLVNEYISYYQFSLFSFVSSLFIFGFIGFLLMMVYIANYRDRGWL